MGTKNFSNYSDMITFSRASSGTALAKISYGAELVTNGTFDTDASGWTYDTPANLPVVGGELEWTYDGTDGFAYQIITTEIGKFYQISADLRRGTAVNAVTLRVGTSDGSSANVNISSGTTTTTTFVRTFVATATNTYISIGGGVTAAGQTNYYDNITVREVLYDQPDGTLQLFNHPANQPRVEYDYQGNRLGLLVEEARTNLQTQSEGTVIFTAYQSADGTANAATAPDGTNNAMLLASTAGGNTRNRAYQNPVSLTGGVAYTLSGFFKKQNVNVISLRVPGGNDSQIATFDFRTEQWDTSVISAYNPQTTVKKYPNGWYRISLTGTPTATSSGYFLVTLHGDDPNPNNQSPVVPIGDGVYIWGAQNEQGSFPTSYIPTSGATATRSVDVASIGVTNFGYNKGAGTTVVRAVSFAPSNFRYFYSFHDNSGGYNNSSLLFLQTTSALPTYQRLSAGAYEVNTTQSTAYTPGQITKFAVAEAIDDMSFVQDANDPKVDTAGVFPLGIETMNIGSSPVNNLILNGHISSIAYYPRRLTDAQIKALTSPPETPTLSLTFDDSSTSYLETSIHG